MEETVIIRIAPDGNAKVTVKGVKGRSCKELTREFEEGLGKKVSDVETSEMYEKPEHVQVKSRA
jgi:hypothetical protein